MSSFKARSGSFRGKVVVRDAVASAFPLFSPEGERSWVPGWDPEHVHPSDPAWREGAVFKTSEASGEAVWIVSRLDRASHRVTYHRIEPGHYVAAIDVRCGALDERRTEATISYSFVGLSERGNREIEAMTQAKFDEKMSRWSGWIDDHLAAR